MVQTSKGTGAARAPCCDGGLGTVLSPKLFKALADPRRLALLVRLAESAVPCTVSDVAEGAGVDLSVVSRHLAILRDAGIIECEKRGKEVWCVVQTRAVTKLLRDAADALEACCPDGWRVDTGERVTAVPPRTTRAARTARPPR